MRQIGEMENFKGLLDFVNKKLRLDLEKEKEKGNKVREFNRKLISRVSSLTAQNNALTTCSEKTIGLKRQQSREDLSRGEISANQKIKGNVINEKGVNRNCRWSSNSSTRWQAEIEEEDLSF